MKRFAWALAVVLLFALAASGPAMAAGAAPPKSGGNPGNSGQGGQGGGQSGGSQSGDASSEDPDSWVARRSTSSSTAGRWTVYESGVIKQTSEQ